MDNSICLDIYVECVNAINNGELIEAVSSRDKEFHFQNWFQKRLENLRLNYETPGRNTYPDFCMVQKGTRNTYPYWALAATAGRLRSRFYGV